MASTRRPRTVFFGSPAFAVPTLEVVARETELVAVVSQPDRPAGRGQHLTEPAVKSAARRLGAAVMQPDKIRAPEVTAALTELAPELFVVVAYGRILPQALLDIPPLGPWNVHASLLPALRGAAPIQWSIIRGEERTGVSIMRMDAGMDTGPVGARREAAISERDTAATLSERLARIGAELLSEVLPAIVAGTLTLSPQDHGAATYAPILRKEDGDLDFAQSARAVAARARGVDPWPGAAAVLGADRVKLFAPKVLDDLGRAGAPGEILGPVPEGLAVACGEGAVAFGEMQLPGRKRLPSAAVLAGARMAPGARFASPAREVGVEPEAGGS